MIKRVKKIWNTIPKSQHKKTPFFLLVSIVNMFLDILSIAILIPFILVILDTKSAASLLNNHFQIVYNSNYLLIGLIFLFTFYILKNILQTFLIKKQANYIYHISSKISEELIQTYLKGSFTNHLSIHKGNLIRDFQKLPITFSTHVLLPLFGVFSEAVFTLLLVALGLYYNALLTLVALGIIFLGFVLLFFWRHKKIKKLNTSLAASFLEEMNQLLNIFFGFLEIKSTKSEKLFLKKFTKANLKHNNQVAELTIFKQSNARYFEIVVVGFIIIILIYFKLIHQMDLSPLSVSVFASVFLKLLPSVNKILTGWLEINANFHAVTILSGYSRKRNPTEKVPYEFQSKITITDAFFRYKEHVILNKLSLTIEKGCFIAISGKSGVGKTTFLKVLTGLLPLEKGVFKIDELAVKGNSNFFPFVSFVPQKPFLFKASLKDNITMFEQKETDMNWLQTLIEKMDLSAFVNQLSKGLETEMDVDTMKISGGQKQRISIMRALYKRPQLLLLDEATNQLNRELEQGVLSFLKELVETNNMSIMAVSHQAIYKEYCSKHIHFS